jgi:hypothetical protein
LTAATDRAVLAEAFNGHTTGPDWDAERRALTDLVRSHRRSRPLVGRLSRAEGRLMLMSPIAAAPVGTSRGSSETTPTGNCPPGHDDRELRFAYERVVRAVDALEQALDAEDGIAPGKSQQARLAEEKDFELFTVWAGTPADHVPRDAGLGSRATIYRKRRLAGFDPLGLVDAEPPAPVLAREMANTINDRDRLEKLLALREEDSIARRLGRAA